MFTGIDETVLWMYQELDEAMGVEAFRVLTEKVHSYLDFKNLQRVNDLAKEHLLSFSPC